MHRAAAALVLMALAVARLSGADPADLVVLGTLHGMHRQNPRYSAAILRDLIVKAKPAVILIELPPAIGGEPTIVQQRVAVSFANDENWSANAAADLLKIPVAVYDRDGRNEYYQKTRYFERETQLNRRVNSFRNAVESAKAFPAEVALLGPLLGNAARSRDDFMLHAGPDAINSEGFDRVIRLKHYIWEELMPELSARMEGLKDVSGEFTFFREEWHERNRIMSANIVEEAKKRPGKCIVVLCGCEHRYILRDLLSSQAEVRLKEFYEINPARDSVNK